MHAWNHAIVADDGHALTRGEGGVILDPQRRRVWMGQGILRTSRHTQSAPVATIRVENEDVLHEAPGVGRAGGGAAPAGCTHQQGMHATVRIDRRFLGLARSSRAETQPGKQSAHTSRRGMIQYRMEGEVSAAYQLGPVPGTNATATASTRRRASQRSLTSACVGRRCCRRCARRSRSVSMYAAVKRTRPA